jgi:hypothetical protein
MILICEPVCVNFEHGEVNFSLLKILQLVYNEEMCFIGDPSHINFIKKLDESNHKNIKYYEKVNPLNNGKIYKRLYNQYFYFKFIFNFANDNKYKYLYFSATTIPGIMIIKYFSFINPRIKIYIIGHAIFENLQLSNNKFIKSYIHYVVRYLHPKNLTYLLYGKNNHLKLYKYYYNLKNSIFSFDLPYIFKQTISNTNLNNNVVNIGSLGIARKDKGSDKFFSFAQDIKVNYKLSNINFIQIGKVIDLPYLNYEKYINFPSPNSSISYQSYLDLNYSIHYSIFFYKEDSYNLTVSASFYDSISFQKPIISIKNKFFESYFNRFGDIGYLVESYEELVKLMHELNNQFDIDRYNLQKNNIKNAINTLSINSVSEYLKEQKFK